ncbi:hypothetical protein ACA910_002996 [Epithemia clementina (nom. ined.)]
MREEVEVLRAREREEMVEHTRGLNQAEREEESSEDDVAGEVQETDKVDEDHNPEVIVVPASEPRRGSSERYRPRAYPGTRAPVVTHPADPANPPENRGTIFRLLHADGRKEFSYLGERLRELTSQEFDIVASFDDIQDVEAWIDQGRAPTHLPPGRRSAATTVPRRHLDEQHHQTGGRASTREDHSQATRPEWKGGLLHHHDLDEEDGRGDIIAAPAARPAVISKAQHRTTTHALQQEKVSSTAQVRRPNRDRRKGKVDSSSSSGTAGSVAANTKSRERVPEHRRGLSSEHRPTKH